MITYFQFAHYLIVLSIVIINSWAVAKGQGDIASATVDAINIQPEAKNDLRTTSLIAMGLLETCAVLSVIFAVALLFIFKNPTSIYTLFAELGIACALIFTGLTASLVSIKPAKEAIRTISRQPFLSKKITNLMLLTLSVMQTSFIFGFIISIIIVTKIDSLDNIHDAVRLFSSGLCIGLGSIGPLIGISKFAQSAYQGISFNRLAYPKILSLTFISQAMIETPVLFSLITSAILATVNFNINPISSFVFISMAILMGIGPIGCGIASGRTASVACYQLARKPELYSLISKSSILTQGFIDASAVYCFGAAMLMLVFNM